MENNFVEFVQISIERYNELIEGNKKVEIEHEVSKIEYEMLEARYNEVKKALLEAYNKDHSYDWVSVRAELIRTLYGIDEEVKTKDE